MSSNIKSSTVVSITELNRGNASRVFQELQEKKIITVLKNNKPIAILTLPEE